MKPYYDHAGIQIYLGDCREILPQLPKVDLVLTDPPYGIEYQSNMRVATQKFAPIQNDDKIDGLWIPQIKTDVLAMFTRWDVLGDWIKLIKNHMDIRGTIVWHKPGGGLVISGGHLPQTMSFSFMPPWMNGTSQEKGTDLSGSTRQILPVIISTRPKSRWEL